jgi:hypothetical protein
LYGTSSVAEAVRDILESDWLLFQMLQSGVANFTALATRIKPNVEERVGNVVSLNTIVASLNRISHILENIGESIENDRLPAGVRLSLSDHVSEVITKIDDFRELTDLYDKLKESRQAPFGIFLTLNTCRFYIDDNSNQKVGGREFPTGLADNEFTKIKIDFPRHLERVPNALIYEISKFLHTNNMDIHAAFFTPSGIVLVVENDTAAKIYSMLREKLK